jgi:hypothetical protein
MSSARSVVQMGSKTVELTVREGFCGLIIELRVSDTRERLRERIRAIGRRRLRWMVRG